jgi:hypothetical protein
VFSSSQRDSIITSQLYTSLPYVRLGKYVYQYGVPQTASEAIPRSERSEAGSSATTTFSSVTANVDSEYHESQEYQFQEQRQTSSSFDDLSNDFAAVSIDPEQAPPSSSSYNQADAGDNPTVGQSGEFLNPFLGTLWMLDTN